MLVSFNKICDTSRIWIFQSDLKIENNKIELIKNELEKFLIQWSSHGKDLQCSYEIKHNLFISHPLGTEIQHTSEVQGGGVPVDPPGTGKSFRQVLFSFCFSIFF